MSLKHTADLNRVYQIAGMCAHHCANIEYRMSFLLVPAQWAKHKPALDLKIAITRSRKGDIKKWGEAQKEFDKALASVEKDIDSLDDLALGHLIQQIKDRYKPTDDVIKYLHEIRMKRNYVIHKIWGEYGRRLMQPVMVKKMLTELLKHESYLRAASEWLRRESWVANGIPEELDVRRVQKKYQRSSEE